MAHGKKLGLFFGNNAFSIVESQNDVLVKLARVPYSVVPAIDVASPSAQAEDAKFAATLKENLRINNIVLTDVHLALPSKDIVIRSFIIPNLNSNEVRSVVEFEIKKYIPFNLKDLAYNFHATPFMEEKIKRMRVHFVAIRKEILERYRSLLKQAGLNVVFSEPASLCLARALIIKKYIRAEQKVALVQTDFNDSRILVIDHGVVQFVRDFQLQNPALNAASLDGEMLKKKLFNEVKISLDFYIRQFKSEKIEEAFTLSFDQSQDLSVDLQKEVEVPVKKIDPYEIVRFSGAMDVGLISAYGAVLDSGSKTVNFNLSGVMATDKPSGLPKSIPPEYFLAIKTGLVCVVLTAAVFFLTAFNAAKVKKQYNVLFDQYGAFENMPMEDIQKKVIDNTNRLKMLKIFLKKTEMAYVLTKIPKLLPEGVWLADLSVRYNVSSDSRSALASVQPANTQEDGINMELSGYAYTEDSNQQFKMVYALVNVLKSDKAFQKYFRNVSLAAIQREQKTDTTVTSFKITCR